MKIVDRKTFLAMPEGFVFQKFEPMIFGEIQIRGESWVGDDAEYNGDFYSIYPASEIDSKNSTSDVYAAIENGASVDVGARVQHRDGMGAFDDENMFAVWERKDIERLISTLQKSLDEAYPEDSQ